MRAVLLAILLMLAPAAAIAQDEVLASTDPYWVIADGIERVIRPGFAELREKADALTEDMAALCEAPSSGILDLAREGFRDLVLAHAAVSFLRFGPLTEENRAERLLFWPDRKGIALRQVQQILADEDETATSLETLQGKSVAVQGLGAFEYALFGTGAETLASDEGAFRCRYAKAVAEAIAAVSAELDDAWQSPDGISRRLLEPADTDADYRTTTESLEELIGAMAVGLEVVRDQQLLPFLGREGEEPKPRSAPFWRSNMTMPAAAATFGGIENLFLKAHVASGLAPEHGDLGTEAKGLFAEIADAAVAANAPPEQLVADPTQRAAADRVVSLSSDLQTVIGEKLPAALSLSTGFSSLDGD